MSDVRWNRWILAPAAAAALLFGCGGGAECSDASGNVWEIEAAGKRHIAYEFPHGGTTPLAKIRIPRADGFTAGCAVDRTTGNLAVLAGSYNGSGTESKAEVFAGAQPGKPAVFPIPFQVYAGGYDDRGNLFIDGYVGSTVEFEFAELPKGGKSFEAIHFDKNADWYPGGVVWDGKYIDVVTQGAARSPSIYRVTVSGRVGHVEGIVHLKRLYFVSLFDMKGGLVAGMSGNAGETISEWPFPGGGKAMKRLANYASAPRGLTISVAR